MMVLGHHLVMLLMADLIVLQIQDAAAIEYIKNNSRLIGRSS